MTCIARLYVAKYHNNSSLNSTKYEKSLSDMNTFQLKLYYFTKKSVAMKSLVELRLFVFSLYLSFVQTFHKGLIQGKSWIIQNEFTRRSFWSGKVYRDD